MVGQIALKAGRIEHIFKRHELNHIILRGQTQDLYQPHFPVDLDDIMKNDAIGSKNSHIAELLFARCKF